MFYLGIGRGQRTSRTFGLLVGICLCASLASCTNGVSKSNLTPVGSKILRDASDANSHSQNEKSSEENLRDSFFASLKGMTQAEAILFLTDNGYSCSASTCTHLRKYRESVAGILFGIGPPGRSEIFGERYSSEILYKIEILSARIQTPTNLHASITFTETTGN